MADALEDYLRSLDGKPEPDPRFADTSPTPEESALKARKFDNTGPDVAGKLKREAAEVGAGVIAPPDPGRKAPEYGTGAIASTQFGEGLTSGLSRSVGAGVDTLLSKAPLGIPKAIDKANEALGGSAGLSPLSRDLTYQQRLSEYAQRDAEMSNQAPWTSKAANLAGAVVGAAAPVSRMTTPTIPGAAALGAAQGAVAGAGYNVDPRTLGTDTLKGAAIGGGMGAAAGPAQKLMAGAEARNLQRLEHDLGVTAQTVGKARVNQAGDIVSREADVRGAIAADKALRAAAGKPQEVAKVAAERMAEPTRTMGKVYGAARDASAAEIAAEAKSQAANYTKLAEQARAKAAELAPVIKKEGSRAENLKTSGKAATANVARREMLEAQKAANAEAERFTAEAERLSAMAASPKGGIKPAELVEDLEKLASAKGVAPAYRNRVNAAAKQVRELEEQGVIDPQRLRDFITSELAPTQAERKTKAAEAVSDVAISLRDKLHGFVRKYSGDGAVAELEAANKTWSTYKSLQDGAARSFDKGIGKAPATPKLIDSVKNAGLSAVDKAAGVKVGPVRPASVATEGTRSSVTQYLTEDDEDVMKSARHAPARSVVQKLREGKPLEATEDLRNQLFGGQ